MTPRRLAVPRRRKPSVWLLPGLALALALPTHAQTAPADAPAPQASVIVAPDGPVAVGTPARITVTVLVPTWMPDPPVWPDLQIADAVTRLPERSTGPVTRRIGQQTWSGVARTWEIIPQRAADYDLGVRQVAITWADPATSQPAAATLDLPDIAFSAIIPPGGEAVDPFLAATNLTLAATADGLPDAPKPGDALTLTATATAEGPPALLLPPLLSGLPTPPGLRAYPAEPTLADGPPATRTEAVTYVVEMPGAYTLPGLSLAWWNTATGTAETATTQPVTFDVPGARAPASAGPGATRPAHLALIAAATVLAALAVLRHARRRRHTPSAGARERALLRAARHDPPATIRRALADWQAVAPPLSAAAQAAIAAPLAELDRAAYGPAGPSAVPPAARERLVAAIRAAHPGAAPPAAPPLPGLNPA